VFVALLAVILGFSTFSHAELLYTYTSNVFNIHEGGRDPFVGPTSMAVTFKLSEGVSLNTLLYTLSGNQWSGTSIPSTFTTQHDGNPIFGSIGSGTAEAHIIALGSTGLPAQWEILGSTPQTLSPNESNIYYYRGIQSRNYQSVWGISDYVYSTRVSSASISSSGSDVTLNNPGVWTVQEVPHGPSPVPIPPSVWLLGSGLIGLVGLKKRFKK